MTKIVVPGTPVGKERPRFTRNGHAYTPDKTRAYEETVRLCWKTQHGYVFPVKVPVLVNVAAYFPIPESCSKKKRAEMDGRWHVSRPDADNIVKIALDALNGYAFPDDCAVQIGHVYKIYTNEAPRLEIELEEL